MATVNTTIIPSTGTTSSPYSSLSVAEADDFNCSSGDDAVCEYAEEGSDTTAVTINTTVPGSIEIGVQSSYRHNGVVGDGAELKPSSGSRAIDVRVPVTIKNLRVDSTNITGDGVRVYGVTGTTNLSGIFVHNQSTSAAFMAENGSSNVVVADRCIAVTSGNTNGFRTVSGDPSLTCYFCTSYTPSWASYNKYAGSTLAVYGSFGCGTYAYYGSPTGDWNADDRSTTYQAPGANSLNNLTISDQFTAAGSDDFTVKDADADIYDAVTVDTYNAYFPDVAGNSESGSHPDIGAFEYAAAATDWDNYIDGVQPAEVDGIDAGDIEEIDGI